MVSQAEGRNDIMKGQDRGETAHGMDVRKWRVKEGAEGREVPFQATSLLTVCSATPHLTSQIAVLLS